MQDIGFHLKTRIIKIDGVGFHLKIRIIKIDGIGFHLKTRIIKIDGIGFHLKTRIIKIDGVGFHLKTHIGKMNDATLPRLFQSKISLYSFLIYSPKIYILLFLFNRSTISLFLKSV